MNEMVDWLEEKDNLIVPEVLQDIDAVRKETSTIYSSLAGPPPQPLTLLLSFLRYFNFFTMSQKSSLHLVVLIISAGDLEWNVLPPVTWVGPFLIASELAAPSITQPSLYHVPEGYLTAGAHLMRLKMVAP